MLSLEKGPGHGASKLIKPEGDRILVHESISTFLELDMINIISDRRFPSSEFTHTSKSQE